MSDKTVFISLLTARPGRPPLHNVHVEECRRITGTCFTLTGYKPYAELEKVVKGRLLVNDIEKLSPLEQTSSLESFHNIVCQFAPKSVHYFYSQMEAWLVYTDTFFTNTQLLSVNLLLSTGVTCTCPC